jgi:hypothetical protein
VAREQPRRGPGIEAAQSDQVSSEVAFGRRDRDAARRDRHVATDRPALGLESDVVGRVPLGVDHTDPAVDRDLGSLDEGPVRFDVRRGRKAGLEPAATPDGRARLGRVVRDRPDVVRVGVRDRDVFDPGGVDGGVEVVGTAGRIDQQLLGEEVGVGRAGGHAPLDRDGNPGDTPRDGR